MELAHVTLLALRILRWLLLVSKFVGPLFYKVDYVFANFGSIVHPHEHFVSRRLLHSFVGCLN
jgi:hypothetical protein